MESVKSLLSSHVAGFPRGTIFFADDLDRLGFPPESVRLALSELAAEGTVLVRLARGVYCHPRMMDDPYAMKMQLPSPEDIAAALARRWRVRIVPCGASAAYRAGLLPYDGGPLTYLSDGSPQHFNLQNGRRIDFLRRRSAKVFAFLSEDMRNLSEGFRHLGKDNVREFELAVAGNALRKVPDDVFLHDLRLSPAWIRDIFLSLRTPEPR